MKVWLWDESSKIGMALGEAKEIFEENRKVGKEWDGL